jgi:hypothetical protein
VGSNPTPGATSVNLPSGPFIVGVLKVAVGGERRREGFTGFTKAENSIKNPKSGTAKSPPPKENYCDGL